MKEFLKKIYFIFVDKYAYGRDIPMLTSFWITMRHRFAGLGIFLNANERKFQALKDTHKGQRCFLIGNGP